MEEETKHSSSSSQVEVDEQDEANNLNQSTIENPILEHKQVIDEIKEARLDNEGESDSEREGVEVGQVAETEIKGQGEMLHNGESKTDDQHAQVGKVEEKEEKIILKKAKVVSKQKYLSKPITPQPSSSATDKRKVREKQSSLLQTTESKSRISKSISLNLKVDTGTKQSSKLRRGAGVTSRSTLARSTITERRTENGANIKDKAQAKDIESKTTEEGETKVPKPKKSTTFKASPLPSFYYHRKDTPPKPELKKVLLARPRSPQLGPWNKSLAEGKNINKDDINTSASSTISITAKETIDKLLKGAWNGPNSPQKKVLKSSSSISRGSRVLKETV